MILFLLAFVAFLIIGVPISVSIGFSAVLGCLSLGYPLVVIGQKMVSGIDSWLLRQWGRDCRPDKQGRDNSRDSKRDDNSGRDS